MSESKVQQLRVTSVPYHEKHYAVFTGVPISDDFHQITSGRYIVTVICTQADVLPVHPIIGQHWRVTGVPRYEKVDSSGYEISQHVYESPEDIECVMPETGESFVRFIAADSDFTGIGRHKAQKIWNTFKGETYSILKRETQEGREKLSKILSDNAINALYAGFQKYSNLQYANWLTKLCVPIGVQARIFKHHGECTIDAITKNPYKLLSFGMKFMEVDQIASTHFSCQPNDSRRLTSALESAIHKEVARGNTYSDRNTLLPTIRRILGSSDLAAQAFKQGFDRSQFILDPTENTFHPTAQYIMEAVVARRFLELAGQRNLFTEAAGEAYINVEKALPYRLDQKQKSAVVSALDNAIACITGGAGTGKTTVLRTVLDIYTILGYNIHAAAISGRAAMRLKESIGLETSTIASFLRRPAIVPQGDDDKHLLVIDESSMIDIPTMYQIVTHIDPGVRILFTGDPNQLPPIGCGKVLADLVDSGAVSNTTLEIVKRQDVSTGIPEYSKLINEGVVPDRLTTGNITFHQTVPEKIGEVCTELFVGDPSRSQVVAPTRALVDAINKGCQQAVNPTGKPLVVKFRGDLCQTFLREGDTVLFTRNNYELGFQNGSLGVLSSVHSFGDAFGEIILDTEERIRLTQDVLDCIDLGYAITLHKAQGSQFPRIIIALSKSRIVDRAWLYTAITRAEADVEIVGSEQDLRRVTIAESHASHRKSALLKLLRKHQAHNPPSTVE